MLNLAPSLSMVSLGALVAATYIVAPVGATSQVMAELRSVRIRGKS